MEDLDVWGHCWRCGHDTPHKRLSHEFATRPIDLFSKRHDGRVQDRLYAVLAAAYQFAKCRRCSSPSLFIDEFWPKTDKVDEFVKFKELINSTGKAEGYETRRLRYPGFDATPFPEWTQELEETEMVLFWEVYSAISLGFLSLAMMGIRTLVDRFANRIVGDIGGFEKKLEKMFSDGHINKIQLEHLRVVVHAGHAASHRGVRYERAHLDTALEVVENLLLIERYGDAVHDLKTATPPRAKP